MSIHSFLSLPKSLHKAGNMPPFTRVRGNKLQSETLETTDI
jgi:hypothetical protein